VLVDDRYVLKVANPGEDPDVLDMENAAMAHVRQVSPDLPVPALMPATSGAAVAAVTDAGGRRCLARLITTIVPGQSHEGRPVTCDLAEQAGGLAARTSLALQGLFHRAGGRVLTGTCAAPRRHWRSRASSTAWALRAGRSLACCRAWRRHPSHGARLRSRRHPHRGLAQYGRRTASRNLGTGRCRARRLPAASPAQPRGTAPHGPRGGHPAAARPHRNSTGTPGRG
jgi:Ser/Thr protein kinase RdoA (MazF antagonist)